MKVDTPLNKETKPNQTKYITDRNSDALVYSVQSRYYVTNIKYIYVYQNELISGTLAHECISDSRPVKTDISAIFRTLDRV